MPAQTKLDLYQSAHQAAVATLGITTSYALENAFLEAFNADNNDPADFDYWKQQFATIRSNMLSLKQQPSPGAAAKIAAAKSTTGGAGVPAGQATAKS